MLIGRQAHLGCGIDEGDHLRGTSIKFLLVAGLAPASVFATANRANTYTDDVNQQPKNTTDVALPRGQSLQQGARYQPMDQRFGVAGIGQDCTDSNSVLKGEVLHLLTEVMDTRYYPGKEERVLVCGCLGK